MDVRLALRRALGGPVVGPVVGPGLSTRLLSARLFSTRVFRSALATAALAGSAALLAPSDAVAQAAGVTIQELADDALRFDGALGDWDGIRMTPVGQGGDGSFRFALGYDTRGLYIAADVSDDRLIRDPTPGDDEDALVVTLATMRGRALEAEELWIFPGQGGRSPAAILIGSGRRRAAVRDGRVIEAPVAGHGYTLEAFVPWAAVGGIDRVRTGRLSIRMRDVDQLAHPTVESEPAFAPVDARALDRLPEIRMSGGETDLVAGFLEARGLTGSAPRFRAEANLFGDARTERALVFDRFLVVVGPGYQEGRGYAFLELPVVGAAGVIAMTTRDLTGDGLDEIAVTYRQNGDGGSRDIYAVYGIEAQRISLLRAFEIRKETPSGSVSATVRVDAGRRGQPSTLTVRAGESRGLSAENFEEAEATDAVPMIFPWGPTLELSYRWDGRAFVEVGRRANPRYAAPSTVVDAPSRPTAPEPVALPSAPSVDALLAEFRRQRGLAAGARPSRELTANVAGSATVERVVVYGRDLVVVGAQFRDGTGWFHYGIPAASDNDLLSVDAADVTGDGRAEILYRVRQTIGDVRREVLVVHQFTESGFPVLLQREVARERAGQRVENTVSTANQRLTIGPGTATGWSADNWPFRDEPGADGVEPPSLPWRDRPVTYRLSNGRLTR